MKILALIVGLTAVTVFLLGYQQKTRKRIIIFNATSRVLYVLQYILLGAFEGAALDIAGIIASALAHKKNTPFVKKHLKLVILGCNTLIVLTGLPLYKNIFSLFPIIGVLFHTGAFWINDEKRIRQVSFIGSPFWLIYDLVSGAYSSCIGDTLSLVSLAIAMFRYDILPLRRKKNEEQ